MKDLSLLCLCLSLSSAPVLYCDYSHCVQPLCWLWLPWLHEYGGVRLRPQPNRFVQ